MIKFTRTTAAAGLAAGLLLIGVGVATASTTQDPTPSPEIRLLSGVGVATVSTTQDPTPHPRITCEELIKEGVLIPGNYTIALSTHDGWRITCTGVAQGPGGTPATPVHPEK